MDTKMNYVDIRLLNQSHLEQQISIRGRIHSNRFYKKFGFITLRYQNFTLQIVVDKKNITIEQFVALRKLNIESIVECTGILRSSVEKIRATSYHDFEMELLSYNIVSASSIVPFQINLDESDKEFKNVVHNDVKLNNRSLDLRSSVNNAIFKIQSCVLQYFRNFLLSNSFTEIHTPKILGAASESGSAVFKVPYFDKKGFLAESPQLHKQMAINADFDKVFTVGPVFRAEKSVTSRHLCEFIGLDIEMTIDAGKTYRMIQEFVWKLLLNIFDNLAANNQVEIKCVNNKFPSDGIVCPRDPLIIKFSECVALLRANNVEQEDLEDFSTPNEKILGNIIKEKYGSDLFIVDQYPEKVRPFYTMQSADNKNYSNSFDIIFRCVEISSGAQRINDHAMLIQRIKDKDIDATTLVDYTNSFLFGSMPHGGCGFGLERIVALYLNLGNVKLASFCPRDPNRIFP
jgi:aspartyl-tRNA synthetase